MVEGNVMVEEAVLWCYDEGSSVMVEEAVSF